MRTATKRPPLKMYLFVILILLRLSSVVRDCIFFLGLKNGEKFVEVENENTNFMVGCSCLPRCFFFFFRGVLRTRRATK